MRVSGFISLTLLGAPVEKNGVVIVRFLYPHPDRRLLDTHTHDGIFASSLKLLIRMRACVVISVVVPLAHGREKQRL